MQEHCVELLSLAGLEFNIVRFELFDLLLSMAQRVEHFIHFLFEAFLLHKEYSFFLLKLEVDLSSLGLSLFGAAVSLLQFLLQLGNFLLKLAFFFVLLKL